MTNYLDEKRYNGKVQAVILDWSGTTADAYVVAPAVVFVEVFKKQNVEISMAEARGPMGLRKDLHIKALSEVDEIVPTTLSPETIVCAVSSFGSISTPESVPATKVAVIVYVPSGLWYELSLRTNTK